MAIIRALFEGDPGEPVAMNPRKSFRAIARNLGIDELTVGERLRKLRQMGFLKGWTLSLNPNLLGLEPRMLLLDIEPSRRDEMVRELSSMGSVVALVEHIGPSMYVGLAAEDERSMQEQVRLVESVTGRIPIGFSIPFPPTDVRLSATDIEIIRDLSTNPRKLYSTVARDLKLSTKTVRRRLTRLIEGKAIFSIPSMDPSSLEGAMIGDLLVEYSEHENLGTVKEELLSKLGDYVLASLGDSNYAFFSFFITRISAIRQTLERVMSIKGIETARLDIVQNRMEFFDHLSAVIERRLPALLGLQSTSTA